MKYWGGLHRKTGKTRYQIMSESHLGPKEAALHMEVAKDYFDVVDRGTKILEDALRIFKAENKLGILPEEKLMCQVVGQMVFVGAFLMILLVERVFHLIKWVPFYGQIQ